MLNVEAYKCMKSYIEKFFAWLKSLKRIIMRCEGLKITHTLRTKSVHLRVL